MENWIDEYGVEYSADRTELIKCPRKIRYYNIKEGTRVIRDCAFYYYTSFFHESPCLIESITIPNSVVSIGERAFHECKSLTSIIIPDPVTSIETEAFAWCENLMSITIPDSVTEIGWEAFSECKNLTSVIIPKGSIRLQLLLEKQGLGSKIVER